jgi:hypothetical protein
VDVLPIVDVSDTTMAASGTTKKITSNQILGAGCTATLASATITGDLTVDTSTLKVDSANNRVGIGTASPLAYALDVLSSGATTVAVRSSGAVGLYRGYAIADGTTEYGQFKQSFSTGELQIVSGTAGWGGFLTLSTGGSERYRIASDGVATWSNVGGVAGTAMTLNSTGLGVGGSPGYKLDVAGSSAGVLRLVNINNLSTDPAAVTRLSIDGQGATWHLDNERTNGIFKITRNSTACLTIDNSGNVGIGVSPSYNLDVRAAAATANVQSSTGTNAVSIVARNTGGSFTLGKENSVGGGSGVFGQDAYASVLWSTGAYPVVFGTNGAHRLQIDSAGNMIPIIQTTAPTLTLNGQMVFNLTSNTNLRISVRGTDGVTRTANITLA